VRHHFCGNGFIGDEGGTVEGRLAGRVAVITGAGSGIGRATVRRFAAEGARVVAVDLDEKSGQSAAEEVGGTFIACDVSDEAQVSSLFTEVNDVLGRVDIAFNNAGISPPDDDSILTTGLEAWERVQRVNLTSVYLCCKYAIPFMQRQAKGSIINTASFVRVNALCPGPVATPLLMELFAKDPERAARRLVHVPMGRFAEPEEIASAVAFLASDDASFITASTFIVDGGLTGAYVTPL
jgi:NAD(P)-dependent dehydrogenase (short-subunit alcohol dehydrogenase family)